MVAKDVRGQRILVLYDKGAVPAIEALAGLSGVARPVFALADTEEARRAGDVLRHGGDTVQLVDDLSVNIDRLAVARVDGIVTFSERMVALTAACADALGLPYHSPATAALLTDKARQRERLRWAGVDDTRCVAVRSVEDYAGAVAGLGGPGVVKPARGGGSRDTYLTGAMPPIEELLCRHADAGLVLEELLVGRPTDGIGDYVSVETAVVDAEPHHFAVTGKFPLIAPFRETGQFWPARLTADEEEAVRDLVTRALAALDFRIGIAHTEVKLTPAGPRLIEVNGRLGGHLNELSSRFNGTNLVAAAGRIALGERALPPAMRPAEVLWQYNNPAPMASCRLAAIGDWHALRAIPGITSYKPYFRVGETVGAGVMTNALDLVCGAAASHGVMLRQVEEMRDALVYRFDFGDGERPVSARHLPEY